LWPQFRVVLLGFSTQMDNFPIKPRPPPSTFFPRHRSQIMPVPVAWCSDSFVTWSTEKNGMKLCVFVRARAWRMLQEQDWNIILVW